MTDKTFDFPFLHIFNLLSYSELVNPITHPSSLRLLRPQQKTPSANSVPTALLPRLFLRRLWPKVLCLLSFSILTPFYYVGCPIKITWINRVLLLSAGFIELYSLIEWGLTCTWMINWIVRFTLFSPFSAYIKFVSEVKNNTAYQQIQGTAIGEA